MISDHRDARTVAAEVPARPEGVRMVVLGNGLTLIVQEDHSAPVVSVQAWCRSGSVDEGAWLGAGLSHLLEHMLFKGTTTRPGGRIDQEVQDAGGYMNAYTSFDRTVYWINVPNDGARVAIDILCDIMQNATLPADELAKEKQVILREMDMLQDDPGRRSSRRLFETAFTSSPYRFPVIGHPDIFGQVDRDHVHAYYEQKYAPNNIFYVVVGDISADAVVEQIQKSFEKAKARPMPASSIPEEPRQTAPREVVEEAPIEMAHFHYCWHIPDVRHPDIPVLDVLATLLGNGRSSRLYQAVRERAGLVHNVDAWTYTPGNAGLFGVSAVADADKFSEACTRVLEELERIKEPAIGPEEISKAVKQFTAVTLGARKTMQGQAQDLGHNWLTASDLNFSERYLAAIKRVGPDDLVRVAQQYLTPANRTLYGLLPAGSWASAATATTATVDHPVQKFEMAGGLRLLVKEDHRLPFVQFRAVFLGGTLAESAELSGITALTSRLLIKGAGQRTAEQIASAIESVGGSLDTYSGNHSFGVHAEVMTGDFALGLRLCSEVIVQPAFPGAELERERLVQLAHIKAQRDHLLQSAMRQLRHSLYGEQAYGLDLNGTETTVTSFQPAHLTAFQRNWIIPANCVLAVFGDITADHARASVAEAFSSWTSGGPPGDLRRRVPSFPDQPQRLEERRDKKQAVLALGFPGTTIFADDRFALELLQESCSDLGSRLFTRIRDELGLAYYVGAQNFLGLIPGFFAFYAGTAPDKAAQVEEQIFAEIKLLRSDGLSPEELKRAKAKVIGQKKIARQDLGHHAMTTALDELYGLGHANSDIEDARFEAVTREQVLEIARKYLVPNRAVLSLILPQ